MYVIGTDGGSFVDVAMAELGEGLGHEGDFKGRVSVGNLVRFATMC